MPGDPTPAIASDLTWTLGPTPLPGSTVTLRVTNVAALRLLDGDDSTLDLTTDGPVAIMDRLRRVHSVRGPLTSALIVVYLVSLLAIEARRSGWLPEPLAGYVATSHFLAIGMVFYVLVLAEIVGLIFGVAESVARAVGKQVEILSLILLRQSFETLAEFDEPIRWAVILGKPSDNRLARLIIDAVAALLIFVLVGYYYRIQHKQPISQDARDQAGFIASKKVVALLLLVGMIVVTARGAVDFLRVGGKSSMFFEEVFSLLIFSDVLIVLISLRYSPPTALSSATPPSRWPPC